VEVVRSDEYGESKREKNLPRIETTGCLGEGKNLPTDSRREGIPILIGGNDVRCVNRSCSFLHTPFGWTRFYTMISVTIL
jgi:hypothetical protein